MRYLPLLILLDKEFRFPPTACNGCHDVLTMSVGMKNITILDVYGVDYRCIIDGTGKSEAIKLSRNADFSEKSESL